MAFRLGIRGFAENSELLLSSFYWAVTAVPAFVVGTSIEQDNGLLLCI